MKKCRVRTFDVFDTCLVRTCGSAAAVFDILARKVLCDGTSTSINDFAKERIDGEFRARNAAKLLGREEVTLSEIYQYCDFSLWTSVSKDLIRELELQVESEVLTAVRKIKIEVSEYRKRGIKIAFISDMYLPSSFIEQQLRQKGFMCDGDQLFVSSDYIKTKSSGALYHEVFQQMSILPSEILHTGYNINSDYFIPMKLGVQVRKVNHDYSYYQKLFIRKNISNDIDLPKVYASISRSLVLESDDCANIRFAADFIAPLFVSYVYYLLFDAISRGFQSIFFCARDGYILYKIALRVVENEPRLSKLLIRYIYVSRKSLYGSVDYSNKSYKLQKNLVFDYLQQCGLTNGKSAIVDLRGTRKCHEIINEILRENGKNTVFGYYIEVVRDRIPGVNYDALIYGEKASDNIINNNIEPSGVFEQYFSMTTQDRTISYRRHNGKIVPVFEKEVVNDEYCENVTKINIATCIRFVDYLSKMNFHCANFKNAFYVSLSVYSNFAAAPSYLYLSALDGLIISENKESYYQLLEKRKFFKRSNRHGVWYVADKVYNSLFPKLWTAYYRFRTNICSLFDN